MSLLGNGFELLDVSLYYSPCYCLVVILCKTSFACSFELQAFISRYVL